MTDVRDRVRGVLLGLAAGDLIGGPARMALFVAESLVECDGFDPPDILSRFRSWWADDAFDTGPVTERVMQLMDEGASVDLACTRVHEESGGQTGGCNPSHRVAPLAMSIRVGDAALDEAARALTHLTHRHPAAVDAAAQVASLCRSLIRGAAWDDAAPAPDAADRHVPLSTGGFSPDVLRAAIHFVGAAGSFRGALDASVAFAGPSNYCPILVGAIAGARWGASAVPGDALADHARIEVRLHHAADALAGAW